MKVLLNTKIGLRQQELALSADRVEIMSYNLHSHYVDRYLVCKKTRVIVGLPIEGERASVIENTVRSAAIRNPTTYFKLLPGSHMKLFVARQGKTLRAIIGSHNLGLGHEMELCVEVEKREAESLLAIFERFWMIATTVKPTNLHLAKSRLGSAVFESPKGD